MDLAARPGAQRTAIIVTGDHGWRVGGMGYRGSFDGPNAAWGNAGDIPIIIHLPAQTRPITIESPTDAIGLDKLAVEIMKGNVISESQVIARLAASPAPHPSIAKEPPCSSHELKKQPFIQSLSNTESQKFQWESSGVILDN